MTGKKNPAPHKGDGTQFLVDLRIARFHKDTKDYLQDSLVFPEKETGEEP